MSTLGDVQYMGVFSIQSIRLSIRAFKLLHSFSETCFPSNDFTILARGTGSLDPCKEHHLAIISLCHYAQTDSGSVKTR